MIDASLSLASPTTQMILLRSHMQPGVLLIFIQLGARLYALQTSASSIQDLDFPYLRLVIGDRMAFRFVDQIWSAIPWKYTVLNMAAS